MHTIYVLELVDNGWRTIVAGDEVPQFGDIKAHVLMEDVPDLDSAVTIKRLFDGRFARYLEEGRTVHGGVMANAIQAAITAFRTFIQTAH